MALRGGMVVAMLASLFVNPTTGAIGRSSHLGGSEDPKWAEAPKPRISAEINPRGILDGTPAASPGGKKDDRAVIWIATRLAKQRNHRQPRRDAEVIKSSRRSAMFHHTTDNGSPARVGEKLAAANVEVHGDRLDRLQKRRFLN